MHTALPVLTQKPALVAGGSSLWAGRPHSPWAGMPARCQASIGLQDLPPTRLACLISATTSQVCPDRMRRPPLPRPRASKPPSRLKVMLLMSGAPSTLLESAGSSRQLQRSAAGAAGAVGVQGRGLSGPCQGDWASGLCLACRRLPDASDARGALNASTA